VSSFSITVYHHHISNIIIIILLLLQEQRQLFNFSAASITDIAILFDASLLNLTAPQQHLVVAKGNYIITSTAAPINKATIFTHQYYGHSSVVAHPDHFKQLT
jgi:hypothetical protein